MFKWKNNDIKGKIKYLIKMSLVTVKNVSITLDTLKRSQLTLLVCFSKQLLEHSKVLSTIECCLT